MTTINGKRLHIAAFNDKGIARILLDDEEYGTVKRLQRWDHRGRLRTEGYIVSFGKHEALAGAGFRMGLPPEHFRATASAGELRRRRRNAQLMHAAMKSRVRNTLLDTLGTAEERAPYQRQA